MDKTLKGNQVVCVLKSERFFRVSSPSTKYLSAYLSFNKLYYDYRIHTDNKNKT